MSPAIDWQSLWAGIEDFLPLLVFIFIWWVSSRRARNNRLPRQGQRPNTNSVPTTGASGSDEVDPMEVLRQMLFGGIEMPPMPPPQGKATEEPFVVDHVEATQGAAEYAVEQVTPPTPIRSGYLSASEREAERDLTVKKVSPPEIVQSRPGKKAMVLARLHRHQLRRAVVWSEVLAPPLSLRERSR